MEHNKASDTKLGILYIIASAFCFALMNLFIRLTGDVPTLQKCFFRNFFALVIAVSALIRSKTPFRIGKGNQKYLIARSVAGMVGMFGNFYAVDHLAISDASILNKLSPFCAIIFSYFLLREKANHVEWLSVIIAFIGALFVAKPTLGLEMIPAAAGIISGVGAGLAYTNVRALGKRGENSMIIVAFFSGFTTLVLSVPLLLRYQHMSAQQWIFLLLTGTAAAGGQIFITKAYAKAAAKEISVYDYSIVIFAAVFGFLFLGQLPDVWSVIGYIIIIGTAVMKWRYSMKHPS